ncbi:protein CutA homolog [Drosophila guanche]|uniref:Blast:Protein CutA homolog n=1 Tax=Drosophila guanche TaxID=7266 RepID=A0A3B0KWX2_DROGU|nr:protein CutA homolog [Drosophila guanche]SPP88548.1 blast:Protein CutA homolog [Drosophila guanche]
MQYRDSIRFLPSRWLFTRKLLIVGVAVAVTSRTAFASTTTGKRILCSTTKMTDQKTCDSSYIAGSNSVAFVTTPDRESAKKLAHGIIDRKIAACVNIIPKIESIYMWEGKVTEDDEYLMMIKTRTERIDQLSKFVRENHPHSVAEVISMPIENGNLPYLNWIAQTVPELKKNKD